MNTTRSRFNKEFRLENLLTLKRAIANGSFKDLDTPNNEWEGAYVIITSCNDRVANSTHEDDIFVLTKHSAILSKLFYYVKENIMGERDFYLYGFMALLANDFIKNFGDINDYTLLLDYVTSGIGFYYLSEDIDRFQVMRFFLSEKISDDEINRIGISQ